MIIIGHIKSLWRIGDNNKHSAGIVASNEQLLIDADGTESS
jgi:hypothetical protein